MEYHYTPPKLMTGSTWKSPQHEKENHMNQMTMENPPFEDVFPIEHDKLSNVMLGFREDISKKCNWPWQMWGREVYAMDRQAQDTCHHVSFFCRKNKRAPCQKRWMWQCDMICVVVIATKCVWCFFFIFGLGGFIMFYLMYQSKWWLINE